MQQKHQKNECLLAKNMMKIAWAKKKNKKQSEVVNTRTPFLARYGQPQTPTRSQNGQFPRRTVFFFLHLFWDSPTFSAESPFPNAQKKALFYPKSHSKSPNHALKKVLTSENTLYFSCPWPRNRVERNNGFASMSRFTTWELRNKPKFNHHEGVVMGCGCD